MKTEPFVVLELKMHGEITILIFGKIQNTFLHIKKYLNQYELSGFTDFLSI